uniref:Uncharacterized protein n=1 Tax=Anguilla anguilla TaxID=7936 RepID=A0A0E9W780_ANGAN
MSEACLNTGRMCQKNDPSCYFGDE